MQFLSVLGHGGPRWGCLDPKTATVRLAHHGLDLRQTLVALQPLVRDAVELRARISDRLSSTEIVSLDEVTLLPPVVSPEKILCVGLNYSDHVVEMQRERPQYPVIFTRFSDTLVASGTPLVAPRTSTEFDFEGELAVVIGRQARNISAGEAAEHILGYSIMNDGSVRDFQRHTHQFTPGKNFPRTGSLGPVIVTPDEFGPIGGQAITTRLNGEVVQSSSLQQLIFSVPALISYISQWTMLRPGDVIATGTPGGVGASRTPPLWMRPGDICEVEIEGIGTLTNPVVEEIDYRHSSERTAHV